MRWTLGIPLLFLLVAPLTGATEPEVLLHSGVLEIDVDPAAVSFLPIEGEELASRLCSGLPPADVAPPIAPRGECDLSVSPPPRLGLFVDGVVAVAGSWQVFLMPTGSQPWRGKDPVITSCGLWEVSMYLDPESPQPTSELWLTPAASNPEQGVFAGVFSLAVRFRFANRDAGSSFEVPSLLPLELSGHWVAAPDGASGLAEGDSNLMLYAGSFGGQWSGMPSCGAWGGLRCPVCFTPPPEVLGTLNSSVPR